MEFEEMKKIWDSQNNQPLYAINEEALHNRVRAKLNSATRLNNKNDMGLILVALVTAILLHIIGEQSQSDYVASATLVLIAGYVYISRIRRVKQEQQFDRSMLGELEHAIANIDYEIRRSKTFVWWFLLPVALPSIYNLIQSDVSLWKWIVVPAAYILAIFVTQWGLKKRLLPKRKHLEALRSKIVDEDSATS